jgi:hypothetical protein
MDNPLSRFIDRQLAGLPGWMLMLSGAALLAAAVLIPAWMETRELDWQRRVMEVQVEQLHQQEQLYRGFLEAVESDDPVVLQRLAFSQLHLKPRGSVPMGMVDAGREPRTVLFATDVEDIVACSIRVHESMDRRTSASVDAALYRGVSKEGEDFASLPPLQSRLGRVCTGPARFAVAGAAVLCLSASILLPGKTA